MKKYSVESSNIESVEYDINSKILITTFKTGSSYSYQEIEPETVCYLLFAGSVGGTFHDKIRKNNKGTKLNTDEETS